MRLTILGALLAGCLSAGPCRAPGLPVVDGRTLPEPIACNDTDTGRCCVWSVAGCMQTYCDSQFSCAWELRKLLRVSGTGECEVPAGYTLLTVYRPPRLDGVAAPRPTHRDGGGW